MIVMSSTSSHVAPPKVTIASRPKTAVGSAHLKTNSAVLVPAPTVAFQQQQQPYEHGRRDNAPTSKLSNHPVPATSHTNTNLFAAPTRPPPPCVRPKSSSSASSTAATRRSVALAAAHSAMPSPRSRPLLSAGRAQDGNLEKARVTTATSPILPSSAANTTGNVYHAMAARKSAEDTATQLARRIAHFRAQEERVLREVQDVKSKLESALLVASTSEQRQHQQDEEGALWPVIGSPHHHPLQGWTENNCASSQSRREPKAPRSREQLQFLTVSTGLQLQFLQGGHWARSCDGGLTCVDALCGHLVCRSRRKCSRCGNSSLQSIRRRSARYALATQ